jgi:hypothetical protein
LHRADFIVIANLLPPENPQDTGKKARLAYKVLSGGEEGTITSGGIVDAKTDLNKVIQIADKSAAVKLRQRFLVGRILGQLLEVEAE